MSNREKDVVVLFLAILSTAFFAFIVLPEVGIFNVNETDLDVTINETSVGELNIKFNDKFEGEVIVSILKRGSTEGLFLSYNTLEELNQKSFDTVDKGDEINIKVEDRRYIKVYAYSSNATFRKEISSIYYDSNRNNKISNLE